MGMIISNKETYNAAQNAMSVIHNDQHIKVWTT